MLLAFVLQHRLTIIILFYALFIPYMSSLKRRSAAWRLAYFTMARQRQPVGVLF